MEEILTKAQELQELCKKHGMSYFFISGSKQSGRLHYGINGQPEEISRSILNLVAALLSANQVETCIDIACAMDLTAVKLRLHPHFQDLQDKYPLEESPLYCIIDIYNSMLESAIKDAKSKK